METLKISIITVTFNCDYNLESTIKSVINQTYKNIDYLIVDGKSTDNTLNIIKSYSISDKRIRYISEVDEGIYDAMNKGIKLCTGDYIFFLNSGDTFYNNSTLEQFSIRACVYSTTDIFYGNIVNVYKHQIIKQNFNIKLNKLYFLKGHNICHQAIFAKSSIMKRFPFDKNYKICSDKNWLIKCFKLNFNFTYIDLDICYYDRYGISSLNRELLFIETKEILKKNFAISALIFYFFKNLKQKIFKKRN